VSAGEALYRAAARAAPAALALLAPCSGRLRRGVQGRRGTVRSMQEWSRAARDPGRPLVWLHAPSVGEALMAQAILGALRDRRPDVQAAFTFFSPSAERVARRVGADWSGWLPWDIGAHVAAALDALQPACVAFVRTEVWPVLGAAAAARGARVVLLNGVLAPGSSRTRPAARFLLGAAYRRLDAIGAVAVEDAGRFRLLGVEPARVTVTGDARFDQVWQRVSRLRPPPVVEAIRRAPGPWLVAGSTWPQDESRIVESLVQQRARGAPWRAVVAPHEPTAAHVAALERRLAAAGLHHARLPADDAPGLPDADVLVVDRTGVLADLYAAADAAYVGGGFGSAGLHSVAEPAAHGVPVLCGPRHGSAREAERLVRAGGGVTVRDPAELADALARWRAGAGRSAAAEAAGAAARRFVEMARGGAAANALLILADLPEPRPRTGPGRDADGAGRPVD
jgi:3-deoxy-D-manno-octulosonic-acid transferase